MITVQTFRDLLTEQLFEPIRLVMSNGRSYDVRHPEMAMLTQKAILVGIDETREGIPAQFKICSLWHAATVEPLNGEAPE